jgi:hypothetical protein
MLTSGPMYKPSLLLFALLGLISPFAHAGQEATGEWALAETVCSALVLRAQKLAGDPDHKRITHPLNRVLAVKRMIHISKLRKESSTPVLPQGHLVEKGDSLPAMSLHERTQLDQAIDRVRRNGGEIVRVSNLVSSFFTVLEDGTPRFFLSERYIPHTVAHELAHFEHWLEVRAVLIKEGLSGLAAAGELAHSLMSTPEGLWLSEQRATQAQYLSAIAQGFAPEVAGRDLYRAHDAAIQANYPALAAMQRSIETVVDLDREPPSEPQMVQIHAAIRNKVLVDLQFYADVTIENTMAEWNRQIAEGKLPAGSSPQTFAAFFGLQHEPSPDQRGYIEWMQGVILNLLKQSLGNCQAAHPR